MIPAWTGIQPVRAARFVWRRFVRRLLAVVGSLLLLGWLLPPVVLAWTTLHPPRIPLHSTAANLPFPAEDVTFAARDGVTLRGWFGHAADDAPVILLGHGYPSNREQLVPYATFLYQAGYNVLLFDWRAWGQSDGAETTFGVHEVDDLSGAMDYLERRPDLHHPRFGGLGLSYGAGLMILGAAHDHRLAAIVPDSSYAEIGPMFSQWNQVHLRIWPYTLAFAPLGEPAASLLLGRSVADLDPLRQASAVAPSALLLIHSLQDHNGLTPLDGARLIYARAQEPKDLWIAPEGDHIGALAAQPAEYVRRVTAFFDQYLR